MKCQNNHDNPDNAKYCRICGVELKEQHSDTHVSFTPTLFPDIKFIPKSVFKYSFHIIPTVVCFVILLILTTFIHGICNYIYNYLIPVEWICILLTCLVVLLFIINTYTLLKNIFNKIAFLCNCEYIEKNDYLMNIRRIAKKGRLGVFDLRRGSTLLISKYDDISIINDDFLLLKKDNKYGLYNLSRHKIIVPVRFDKFYKIEDSIVTMGSDSVIIHYDTNGNRLH